MGLLLKQQITTMRRKLILFICTLFGQFSCYAQNDINISKINLYKIEDLGKGYTTASAYGQFVKIEDENIESVLIDDIDINIIQNIINKSKTRNLHHEKTGLNVLFLTAYFDCDSSFHKMVLCQNNCFIDFTSKKEYWIKEDEHKASLDSIRKKYNVPIKEH